MTAPAAEATVTQGSATWANIAAGATGSSTPKFAATVPAAYACGKQVHLTINVASSSGPLTIPVVLQTGTPGGVTASQASGDVPKSIPDNNPAGVTSNLVVSAFGILSDMNVTIGSLTHTWDGDLVIQLISPAGTTVTLANRTGGASNSGDNYTNTVFNDAAATPISSGTPPYTGSFQPFQPLSAFNGQQIHGTWMLKVADLAVADTGTLNSWSHARAMYGC
jgi:subtilisin-like proprotein convertase family protein